MLNGFPDSNSPVSKEMQDQELSSLSRALVFLARRLDCPCEEVEARRLLAEVIRSNPGRAHDCWQQWLSSAGMSFGLTLRVSDIAPQDIQAILQSDVSIAAERSDLRAFRLADQQGDQTGLVSVDLFRAESDEATIRSSRSGPIRVVIAVNEPELRSTHHEHEHEQPWELLWKLLAPDQKDLWAAVALSGVAGLLMLSVPVTAQQLLRTVTFATLYQPIVVLSLMLMGLLGFVAALQALQVYVAEIIQRRLFIRIAGQAAQRLSRADVTAWSRFEVPKLADYFLEVAIVQKVTAALVVDGVAIVLTTLISMSVMAFYHPFLLGYDVLLLTMLAVILIAFGRNGVKTAIQESRSKYDVLHWLESMAYCPGLFRTGGAEFLAMQRTDLLCADYLRSRGSHFSILMRQIVSFLMLQAIATTSLLGLGGFLVLNEQLTLGQLVAAELIVAMIVASFAKLGKHLEGWYDLLASIDKLSHLFELPMEPHDGLIGLASEGAAEIVIRKTETQEPRTSSVDSSSGELLRLPPGKAAILFQWNHTLTNDLAESFQGLRSGLTIHVTLDGVPVKDIRPDVLRQHVAVAAEVEFLSGTIAENIHLSRPNVSESDLRNACDAVGLMEELRRGGLNLSTELMPNGRPLNALQRKRLVLARSLAGKPRALFIDHLCDVFAEPEFQQIWKDLSSYLPHTTILVATVRRDIAAIVENVVHSSSFVSAPIEMTESR